MTILGLTFDPSDVVKWTLSLAAFLVAVAVIGRYTLNALRWIKFAALSLNTFMLTLNATSRFLSTLPGVVTKMQGSIEVNREAITELEEAVKRLEHNRPARGSRGGSE